MSRVGKKPIIVPNGVTASVERQAVKVKGVKGELDRRRVNRFDVGHGRARRW